VENPSNFVGRMFSIFVGRVPISEGRGHG
jgi:hypothetical protein